MNAYRVLGDGGASADPVYGEFDNAKDARDLAITVAESGHDARVEHGGDVEYFRPYRIYR